MNQTLAACRRQLADIRSAAADLDCDLATLQQYEANGEQQATALTASKLLVGLDDAREQLEQLREAFGDAVGDVPEPMHAGGAGGAPR